MMLSSASFSCLVRNICTSAWVRLMAGSSIFIAFLVVIQEATIDQQPLASQGAVRTDCTGRNADVQV